MGDRPDPAQRYDARPRSDLRRLVQNSGTLLTSNVFVLAILLAQGILVARTLGPSDYGVLGLVYLVGSIALLLLDFRVSEALIRYVVLYRERGQPAKARWVIVACCLIASVTSFLAVILLTLVAGWLATSFVREPSADVLIRLYGWVLVATSLSAVGTATLRALDQFRSLSVLAAAVAVVRLLAIWALLSFDPSPRSVVAGQLASGVVALLLTALVARRAVERRLPGAGLQKLDEDGRSFRRFLIHTNINAMLGLVTKEGDLFFLGLFTDPVQAGHYRFAKSLAQPVGQLGDAVANASYPQLSQMWISSPRRIPHFLGRLSSLLAALLVPGVVVAAIFAEPIVTAVGGGPFAPSATAFALLVAGYAVAGILSWARPAILAVDRPRVPSVVNGIGALAQITAAPLLVPRFGIEASAAILAGLYVFGSSATALVCVSTVRSDPRVREESHVAS